MKLITVQSALGSPETKVMSVSINIAKLDFAKKKVGEPWTLSVGGHKFRADSVVSSDRDVLLANGFVAYSRGGTSILINKANVYAILTQAEGVYTIVFDERCSIEVTASQGDMVTKLGIEV